MKLIKKLISIDADWVPRATPDSPSSLYIRPTSIGTEVSHTTWYQYSRTSIIGPGKERKFYLGKILIIF